MSLTVTTWRLTDEHGRPNQCFITRRGGRWFLIVSHNEQVVVVQRCQTDDVALQRADGIWSVLVRTGWRDPVRMDSGMVGPISSKPTH